MNLIRQYDNATIILVSGVSYSFDLSGVVGQPVIGTNVAYVVHPYPNENCGGIPPITSDISCWDENFGNTAAVYPVFATEWGYYTSDQTQCASSISSWTWDNYGSDLLVSILKSE